MAFPKHYAETVARMRVPVGIFVAILFIWLSWPDWRSLSIGTPFAFSGILLRSWAAGHLEKNVRLTVSGPFARVRNPLYLGSLLVGFGIGVAANSLLVLILTGFFFLCFYLPVVEEEERHLRELFPSYQDYQKSVPRLIPLVRPVHRKDSSFRWNLYSQNREYQALVAFFLIFLILLSKAA